MVWVNVTAQAGENKSESAKVVKSAKKPKPKVDFTKKTKLTLKCKLYEKVQKGTSIIMVKKGMDFKYNDTILLKHDENHKFGSEEYGTVESYESSTGALHL